MASDLIQMSFIESQCSVVCKKEVDFKRMQNYIKPFRSVYSYSNISFDAWLYQYLLDSITFT